MILVTEATRKNAKFNMENFELFLAKVKLHPDHSTLSLLTERILHFQIYGKIYSAK